MTSYAQEHTLNKLDPGWVTHGYDQTESLHAVDTSDETLQQTWDFFQHVHTDSGDEPTHNRFCRPADTASFEQLGGLKLDPISEGLVAGLLVVKLLNALAVTTEAMWVQKLKEVFDKNAGDHWCGFQTPVDLSNNKRFISTREMFKSHIEELAKSSLLRQVQDACGGRGRDRFFMSIFVVLKGLDSLRFIANCQFLNKFFDKPPKVVFADMDSLFRIFTFFGPRTFFAVADFPLVLPDPTVGKDGQVFQRQVWRCNI